jgi:uncharacterized membrane protein
LIKYKSSSVNQLLFNSFLFNNQIHVKSDIQEDVKSTNQVDVKFNVQEDVKSTNQVDDALDNNQDQIRFCLLFGIIILFTMLDLLFLIFLVFLSIFAEFDLMFCVFILNS